MGPLLDLRVGWTHPCTAFTAAPSPPSFDTPKNRLLLPGPQHPGNALDSVLSRRKKPSVVRYSTLVDTLRAAPYTADPKRMRSMVVVGFRSSDALG